MNEANKNQSNRIKSVFLSRSASDTQFIGKILARVLQRGTVIAIYGQLGSGKTVLVKGICQQLDVKEDVTSPSFTIMNMYYGKLPIYHFDFYRLEKNTDWSDLGVDEYFYGEGIVLIEWAERLREDWLPDDSIEIFIQRIRPVTAGTENHRRITIHQLLLSDPELNQFMCG